MKNQKILIAYITVEKEDVVRIPVFIDSYDKYYDLFNINKVSAPRVVNCKADKRQSVYETLITNF